MMATTTKTRERADREYKARLKRAQAQIKRERLAAAKSAKAAADKARRYEAQQKRDRVFRARLEARRKKDDAAKERRARTLHAKGRRGDYIARRNPGDGGERAAAIRQAVRMHGTASAAVELSAAERKPAPRYAVEIGKVKEIVYEVPTGSLKSSKLYRHVTGDRGVFRPKSNKSPLLVADAAGHLHFAQNGSPMRLDGQWIKG